jgi:hypothetical protein
MFGCTAKVVLVTCRRSKGQELGYSIPVKT